MPKHTLRDTWIEGERRLGEGSVLVESDGDVFVSLPMKNGGWERVGPMKAYGPVVVGQRLALVSMQGEGVNATKVTEAIADGDAAYVLKTSEGLSVRIETFGQREKETPPANRIAEILGYVRGRFGL